MARYDNLEDNIVSNLMRCEGNFTRAKIFSFVLIIGMPLFMFFIIGLNYYYTILSLFAAILFSSFILLSTWLELRSCENSYHRKHEIQGKYR
jgi:small-conductance mechanosensitive channel